MAFDSLFDKRSCDICYNVLPFHFSDPSTPNIQSNTRADAWPAEIWQLFVESPVNWIFISFWLYKAIIGEETARPSVFGSGHHRRIPALSTPLIVSDDVKNMGAFNYRQLKDLMICLLLREIAFNDESVQHFIDNHLNGSIFGCIGHKIGKDLVESE